ncbi:hypothetical protein KIPB_012960, partial [Kipferlia bialata]|eukprot:g12960.t1
MLANTVEDLLAILELRDGDKPEFKQAVEEVIDGLKPVFEKNPAYIQAF